MKDPNLQILQLAVNYLGDLTNELVFIGGATIGLYIDDPAVTAVRPTEDVDCVVEVANLSGYYKLIERLRQHGFTEDTESKIICRYLHGEVVLDVMPTEPGILSFSNRWYTDGIGSKRSITLPGGVSIFIFTLPYLVASKVEAFKGRGKGDFYGSKDIEDIITIVDGASGFESEISNASKSVLNWLRLEFGTWLGSADFRSSVEGHISDVQNSSARGARALQLLETVVSIA